MSIALVWGMVAVSLVVLTGWGGHISLGQFAIVGTGAVTSGLLQQHANVDFFVTLAAAGAVGAVVALLLGLPALRIRGPVPRRDHPRLRRRPRQLLPQPDQLPVLHPGEHPASRSVGTLHARERMGDVLPLPRPARAHHPGGPGRAQVTRRSRAGGHARERPRRRSGGRADHRGQAQRVRAGRRHRRHRRRAARADPAPRRRRHLQARPEPRRVLHGRDRRARVDRRCAARRVQPAPARTGGERRRAPARHRRRAARDPAVPTPAASARPSTARPCCCASSPNVAGSSSRACWPTSA